MEKITVIWLLTCSLWKPNEAFLSSPQLHKSFIKPLYAASTTTKASTILTRRIPINENYPGLRKVHSNPDIYTISNFLDYESCQDLIQNAKSKKMETSPVAYAGWTTDVKDLVELAAKGPVSWFAILGAWFQTKNDESATQFDLLFHMAQNYASLLLFSFVAIGVFTYSRAESLKSQRTSTSTTLDNITDPNGGTAIFVKRAADLFRGDDDDDDDDKSSIQRKEAALFEAPTVIRYEAGQVLMPHFDANRSAEMEDANRGGQTLATLLVYLNDVQRGGLTRFGRLDAVTEGAGMTNSEETKLTVKPKMGDALLFFPADARGNFDERTEHEGCPAVDEKWIARIWRHKSRVPPPFGLSDDSLNTL